MFLVLEVRFNYFLILMYIFSYFLKHSYRSVDGTMRKNNIIWNKWHPQGANNLYFLQLKIAKRAAELLAKDGLMVYSTCSLNPIEDEVVVLSLLKQANGGLELVDVEDKLENLKHLNGLERWVLMQKNLKILNSFEDVEESSKNLFTPDMFPADDVGKYHLKRCIRIMPHLQDTGGFFIAVLRKTTDRLAWESGDEDALKHVAKKPRLDKRSIGYKEEPFLFVAKDDPDWLKIKEYYSISDDFPSHRLFYRSEKGLNHLNYIAESAIDVFNNSKDNVKVSGILVERAIDHRCLF